MNNPGKPRRTGIAGIASVLGGLLGALSRFRTIGREVRDLAEDLAHAPGEIQESLAAENVGKEVENADAQQPRSHEAPESGDVIDRKLEKIKPNRASEADLPPGWNLPRPHKLPRPTYWPAVLAGGVVVFAWGPPTSWVVSLVGGVVSMIAIRGWIGELRHESKSE